MTAPTGWPTSATQSEKLREAGRSFGRPNQRESPLRGEPATALAISLILLLVGIAGLATVVPGAAGGHVGSDLAATTSPASLLTEARATAAAGAGPGAVAVPSNAPHPFTGPNVSFGVAMTYDAADGYVVAVSLNATFGANNSTYGPTEITWKFLHGNWSAVPTNGSVPATLTPGMVYDARDGYVVLYGGYLMATIPAPVTNQTWSYRGGTWTNLTSTSSAPTAVDFSNLVFDASDNYVLLDDELGLSASPNGTLWTTWSYANGTWSNLTATAGPAPPSFFGGMTYDVRDQYVVYFGGETLADQLTNATWTFHSGVWSNISRSVTNAPGGRLGFGITYDSGRQAVLLYGGLVHLLIANWSEYGGDTWQYANGTWTQIASNGTVYNPQSWNTPSMNMVYDPADNETVLFGANISQSAAIAVTWTFSSSTWTVAAPVFVSVVTTTDVGRAITFAVTQPLNPGGVSYQYSGLPAGCRTANSSDLRCVPAMTGSYRVVVRITGAGGFDAATATALTVNPAPALLSFRDTAAAGEVGIPLGFAVTAVNGTGSLSYAYGGLPTGCTTTNASELRCVPAVAGMYSVTATVSDSLGVTVLGTLQLTVVPSLTIVSLAPNHPQIDVGQVLSVVAGLSGGLGPFAYSYAELPAGCATSESPILTCDPTAAGSFSITFATGDSLGGSAQGSTRVVVNPLPKVTALVPSSAVIPAGGSVQLTATISGGTAPFHYAYEGLPSGCSAGNAATVACAGTPSGRYAVVVTVTDATGASANATASFTATPAPSQGPSGAPGGGFAAVGGNAFWWGLAVGAIAIGLAGILGWNRLRLAREGEQIVRELRQPSTRTGAVSETDSIDPAAGGPRER